MSDGDFWILEFPNFKWPMIKFRNGQLIHDWNAGLLHGFCPEGEDRATDYMFTMGLSLFSNQFAEEFSKQFPDAIQFLPITYGPRSGEWIKSTHSIGQILYVADAIDKENAVLSIGHTWPDLQSEDYVQVYLADPVVLKSHLAIQYPIFRTKYDLGPIYVREDMRQFIEEHAFTGIQFDADGPILTTDDEPVGPDGKSLRVKAEVESLNARRETEWQAYLESQKESKKWFKRKSQYMARHLGPQAKTVTHAIIPFEFGGGLALHYYPKEGSVAIATKELSLTPNNGPRNLAYDCYELVMFVAAEFQPADFHDEQSQFGQAMTLVNATLEQLGRYVLGAELNHGDTVRFPDGTEVVGGKTFIVDTLTPRSRNDGFGLMGVFEINPQDFQWCHDNGGDRWLAKMKKEARFPFDTWKSI